MALPDFGQYVKLTVQDIGGRIFFATDALRVDFDVIKQQGYSVAKIDIYNLNKETIKAISGDNLFVTISVSQHGGPLRVLVNNYFISNSNHELKLPQAITSLYAYSDIKYNYLDKQIDVITIKPSISRVVEDMVRATGFRGKVLYKNFPDGLLDYIPLSPTKHSVGSLGSRLAIFGKGLYSFYTEGSDIVVVYLPKSNNVHVTDLARGNADVTLTVSQMRANPKIGQAEINITSNLNVSILAGQNMDVSKLITASVDVDKETLALAQGLIKGNVAGYDRYLVISIEHRGSNYTKEWSSFVYGTYPSLGTTMPTKTWFMRGYT
jgi:hypothetical protein